MPTRRIYTLFSHIHCNNPCYTNQNSTLFETTKWTLVSDKGKNEDSFSLHVREENEEVIVNGQTAFDANFHPSTIDLIGSCLTTRTLRPVSACTMSRSESIFEEKALALF